MVLNCFEKYDEYIEKLLNAQFDVSEMIEHQLTKGEIREDFLKDIIRKQFSNIKIVKGILTDGSSQSPQCDILIVKNNARIRTVGEHNLIDVNDCLIVLEVKSNATGRDIKKFNRDIALIENLNGENKPLYGIFCYKLDLAERTVLRRFGYLYDNQSLSYRNNSEINFEYPNIDFFLSLHYFKDEEGFEELKQFYLRKVEDSSREFYYVLDQLFPVSKEFFNLIQSISQ